MASPTYIPSAELRPIISGVLDQVFHHNEQFVITRNRKSLAAIIHPDDLTLLTVIKGMGVTLEAINEGRVKAEKIAGNMQITVKETITDAQS